MDLKATRQELVERRTRARRSMRESDEEWQDEVRRLLRDMLAGVQRIADVLERMADLKSGSQNLWMDGVKMRIRKGRKLDLEWTEWKRNGEVCPQKPNDNHPISSDFGIRIRMSS